MKDIKIYESEINVIKQELKKIPSAYLVRSGQCYYEKKGSVKKGITKNPNRIMQLARRAYLLQRLKHLEWNLAIIKKQSGQFKTEDQMEIIKTLSPPYQVLPISYFFHTDIQDHFDYDTAVNAGRVNNREDSFHPEGLVYFTNTGLRVRSKSERFIADALDQNKIPYKYEHPLSLRSGTRYPDFTIYRPSDGKLFLWEHFGLMDNDEYRSKAIEKLAFYEKNGFVPFENLILTFENDMQNPSYIQSIVEAFFLR